MSNRPAVTVEGSHAYYRASSSGLCVRALAGLRMGMDPLAPSEDMKRRFKDGHLHEGPILEAVEEAEGQAVVRRQEEWTIDISERVTVIGHVDGITADNHMPVEAKSAAASAFKDWEQDAMTWFKVRPYYADQWTLTLAAYGKTTGLYAVKNKDSGKVLIRYVPPIGTLQEIKVRLLRADLDGRRGKLPECDRTDNFFCPLRYLHDDKERTEAEVDEDLGGLAQAYDEAREGAKRAEAVQKELGGRLKDAMGERERVDTGEFSVVMSPWTRVSWDQDKLRETLGDIGPYQNVNSGVSLRVTRKEKGAS